MSVYDDSRPCLSPAVRGILVSVSGMEGKTVVVTGASSGIGLETARALSQMGARIVMVVRNRARGQAAIDGIAAQAPNAQLDLVIADLYTLSEVRRAAAEIRAMCRRVDVLVNNAGLIHDRRELTVDGFERTFALNHLAVFLLTYELREMLAASAPARVVTVSSWGHNFARFEWEDLATMERWKGPTAVYGASKLCNIWFARESARKLARGGVTSNALHPGAVASNFGASGPWLFRVGTRLVKPFMLTSQRGAQTSIHLASSTDVADVTGEYFVRRRIATPSRQARDDDSARRLWQLSEQLCGVTWG
jgi:NAD(P)-dependent dehydrogenase (short-subunit alcohol dehydrogenase family)